MVLSTSSSSLHPWSIQSLSLIPLPSSKLSDLSSERSYEELEKLFEELLGCSASPATLTPEVVPLLYVIRGRVLATGVSC
ncbi:hypothetical protein RRG08_044747 [Elysia crispata]|uniref:Uncharacterized protein n=1 Tax=Elysia crispata TaxID=231223 RepID=A0AAE0ZHQ4_9GAST|nr:hypothetical protein RRG08_044747 [Elysia crispata]